MAHAHVLLQVDDQAVREEVLAEEVVARILLDVLDHLVEVDVASREGSRHLVGLGRGHEVLRVSHVFELVGDLVAHQHYFVHF